MCCVAIITVSRTSGFENIRAVQFLLIFAAGALLGVALGFIRSARTSSGGPANPGN